MEPSPLPGALREGPFAVADARALDVGPQRLRRGDLVAPTRGARSHTSPLTTHDRASAILPALPGEAVFSHVTAARLWNLPLPRDLEARTDLDVMTRSGAGPVERTGCRGHRGTESRTLTAVDALPVVQGEEHATRRRRSEDSFRREAAGDARWTVHEVWAEDLARPARRHVLVQRVARSVGHVLGPYAA